MVAKIQFESLSIKRRESKPDTKMTGHVIYSDEQESTHNTNNIQ